MAVAIYVPPESISTVNTERVEPVIPHGYYLNEATGQLVQEDPVQHRRIELFKLNAPSQAGGINNDFNYNPLYSYTSTPDIIDISNPYTLYNIIDQLAANNYQPITLRDRYMLASNGNDSWKIYGTYSLDNQGKLQRQDAGTDHWERPKEDNGFGGLLDGALSALTGGVSDIVQGNPVGSASVQALQNILPDNTFIQKALPSFLLPAEAGMQDIHNVAQSDMSGVDKISTIFEELADPTSTVNPSLAEIGKPIPKELYDTAGNLITGVLSAVNPGLGALSSGIQTHMKGGDSTAALTGAGITATAAGIMKAGQGLMSTPVNPDQAYIDQVANSGVFNNITNGTVPVDGIYESQLSNQGLSGLLGNATPQFVADATLAVPALNAADYVMGGKGANLTPEEIYTNQAVNDLQGAVTDTALGTNTVYTPADAYAAGDLGLSTYSGTELPQFSVNTSYKTGLLDNILKHKTDIAKLASKGLNAYLDGSTPQFTMPSVGKAAEFKFNAPKLNTWSDYTQKLAGQTQNPLVGSNRIIPLGLEDAQKTKYLRNALDYKNDLQTRLADQKNLKYWSDYLGG